MSWIYILTGAGLILGSPLPENVRFRHLTQEHGLSSNLITSIVQDDLGFVWIGTKDGLNRYDGYQITIYQNIPDDPSSISNNQVNALIKDHKNNIWIGTADGLSVYELHSGKFKIYKHDPENPNSLTANSIRTLFEDSNNNIWVGTTNGLNCLAPGTGKIQRFYHDPGRENQLNANVIFSINEDPAGQIWIGTHNGLSIRNPSDSSFTNILFEGKLESVVQRNVVFNITMLKDSSMLIGTLDGVRRVFRTRNPDSPNELQVSNLDGLDKEQVFGFLEDSTGHLWIGSGSGLICKDLKSDSQKIYINTKGDPESLLDNYITCMMKDYSGLIWLGTEKGISIYDPSVSMFRKYSDNLLEDDDLNNDNINSIYQDEEGILWLGTLQGLYSYDQKAKKYRHHSGPGFPEPRVSDIRSGRYPYLWLATSAGLYRYNRQDGSFKSFKSETRGFRDLKLNILRKIESDGRGSLWVGGFGALFAFDPQKERLEPVKFNADEPQRIAANSINCMLRDKHGNLWVGCEYGLNLKKGDKADFVHFYHHLDSPHSLGSNHVTDICEDQNGHIWIGTYGGGLNRYQPGTNDFYRLTVQEGLPSNVIRGIQLDNAGNLWVSTSQGLSRILINQDPPRIDSFDQFDGLGKMEFNSAVRFRSDLNGELYFGGTYGMISFDPSRISFNLVPPKIILTAFRIFNKAIEAGSDVLPKPISITDTVVLSYKQNFISVGFAAAHFGGPGANRYAYRLLGFDQDWIYTDSGQRFCVYSNLHPGEYTLQVIAANEDGVWNMKGKALHLIIIPPFWQRWWFRVLSLMLIGTLIYLIMHLRTRRISRHNLELRHLNEQLNHEISERREAEHKIRELNLKLEERVQQRTRQLEIANMELEAFAYSVSHDLRAPLRSIGGFTQILFDEYRKKFDQQAQDYIQRVQNGVTRMSQLIDDLLTLSRISREELKIESVNLSRLFEEIIEQKRIEDPKRNVIVHIQPDIVASCDIRLIRHALENLIDNAWKFTRYREETHIEFGVRVDSGTNWYFISDNGAGFDMRYFNKLFTPFGRLHSDKEFAGTGIGLATVQRIIHRHGGLIKAESEPENGAVFLFRLDQAYREPSHPTVV